MKDDNEKEIRFRAEIDNADTWSATWITSHFYYLVDTGKITSIEIREVKKSDNSIKEIIDILVKVIAVVEDADTAYIIISKTQKYLDKWKGRWKQAGKQTTLKTFTNDKPN